MTADEYPQRILSVSTYSEFAEYVQGFADGHFNLLIVIGRQGLQKSRMFTDVVGKKACWISGTASPVRIYVKLFQHRNKSVVLDDVDGLHKDATGITILKGLCETVPRKRVCYDKDAAVLRRESVPREFTTSSRVAIIANSWKTINANVAAVEDRGHVLLFDPSPQEIHVRTALWFWDQEVFDFVGEHLPMIAEHSMRDYVRAWELKQAGIDWRDVLLRGWLEGDVAVVAAVLSDSSFGSEEERVQAFIEQTGRCRATYFNYKKRLAEPAAVQELAVEGVSPKAGWRAKWKSRKGNDTPKSKAIRLLDFTLGRLSANGGEGSRDIV